RHVVFLKVHKAGSTTMLNILSRFALSRQLNVLMHNETTDLSQYNTKIPKTKVMSIQIGEKYDMLFHHIVFNHTDVAQFFPRDVKYIAIVRNPFDSFISMFKYVYTRWNHHTTKAVERTNPRDPIKEYLTHPLNYSASPLITDLFDNRMSVDFGVNLTKFREIKKSPKEIGNFINKIDKVFDFVLVLEYFEESLVMLKRLMGWSLKDIVFFKLNSFKEIIKKTENTKNNSSKDWLMVREYPEEFRVMHRQWATIDYAVYSHFLRVFKEKMKSQSCNFEGEVDIFKQMLTKVNTFCSNKNGMNSLNIDQTMWSKTFEVTRNDCSLMTIDEIEITGILRKHMRVLYRK
ncbi:hypothetical protein EGW08_022610, partial [Elysia chlorotica]